MSTGKKAQAETGGGLVERSAELAEIEVALRNAVAGEGSLVVLAGPAGIGKTALLEAGRQFADRSGLKVLTARGSEFEGGFPYGVARQLLESTVQEAGPAARKRLLAGAAGLAGPAVLRPQAVQGNPVEQAFAVVHGLYWLVANIATESPVSLLIDDVHWSDGPSMRFIVYLARRLDGLAATVIASIRTGEGTSDQALADLMACPGARLVTPAALSDQGVTSMLASVFGREPDAEFARSCAEVTGGNPFFVRELAVALKLDGIEPTEANTGPVSNAAPPTISRAALAHLGRLPDDAAELARAIAVLGSDATMPRAAALGELDEPRAMAAIDALVASEVVRFATIGLEFCHPIMHTAIYGELAPGARSAAHRQAAALLTAQGADLDAIAGHLVASQPIGDPDTITTLRETAARALATGAPDSAVLYLTRALEEGPERELRAATLLELGLAELVVNQPTALAHLDEVCRLTEDRDIRARAIIERAGIAVWQEGNWPQALALLEEARADLADGPQALRLRAEAMHAGRTMYDPSLVGTFIDRLPVFEELIVSGGPGTRPLALLLAAWAAQHGESLERVGELVRMGWDDGRYLDEGDPLELLAQGVGAFVYCDEMERAAAMLDRVRHAAETSGSVMQYLIAEAHDALIHSWRGDLAIAAAELRGGLERAMEAKLPFAVLSILWYCADVLLERPDVADLAALVETIELGPLAEIQAGAMLTQTRGLLRFAAGDREGGISDLRHAGAATTRMGYSNWFGGAWRSTLALMLDPSEREEAVELTIAELDDARRSGEPRRIGVALRALGMLEADRDSALSRLEEAVNVLAGTSARLEYARALVELGAARRRSGERAAAREPLREGLDLATHCGAVRLAERAGVELAATGARPRRSRSTGRDALTPSELRVALMAADGLSSQEIAQQLFVTTRTIDAHLSHTYSKLGINSRNQLGAALTR